MRALRLLWSSGLPDDIEIHDDLLSFMPTALSRRRAEKVGREKQEPMKDNEGGTNECILCDPENKKRRNPGGSIEEVLIAKRVTSFSNDFPYLPGDQRVVFLYDKDINIRKQMFHRFRLDSFGKTELYWLTKACVGLGRKYDPPSDLFERVRPVVGFNLGKLAGQSISHFHMQYGWEHVLDRRAISNAELSLFLDELHHVDLVLNKNTDQARIVAPWTPMGQYALDLYFTNKFEVLNLEEDDLKLLAVIGETIINHYLKLGIQNLNIVFSGSPRGLKTEPLVIHFVPRVNMTALYEIRGVNVVDTPPHTIAERFRPTVGVDFDSLVQIAERFDPDQEFKTALEEPGKQGKGGDVRRDKVLANHDSQ